MAGMNIAETRAPQDGRMSLAIGGHQIDFRVSCMLTTHGENIVLRVLDRDKGIMQISDLGLPVDTNSTLNLMMARPEGLILVTGPTGSGKTTTLYSMLNHLNNESVNIMTLEDPVEYPMNMIRQCSVNEAAKIDFASGIRSLMRQDPDIILVGEIRDEETADMAFRAAMTGHQVYSTLHTNSAVGAIPRLLDIGVLPDVVAGNMIGIMAQRLVRKLCAYCKTPYQPEEGSVEYLLLGENALGSTLYRATGCARCDHQGYKGRLALMEVLRMTPELDELIFRRATRGEMLDSALSNGFRPISEDGLRRVRDGVTSLEEVSRVVDLTNRV
jgi:type II secretory ATPase GspE/PulE/Tfp pilus assembly ATPase PilB-like protein